MTFALFFSILAAVFVAPCQAFLGCDDPMFFETKMVDDGLKKFYLQTQGPTKWPAAFRGRWDADTPCAWDGNERANPPPFGTRCTNGGWHRLPPKEDGGLLYLFHCSGQAEGPIPEEFKSFQMTQTIQISHNKLNGSIWNTSYHCFMQILDLSHNQLSGTLGEDFMQRNYQHAETINLAFNQFEGPIPARIGTFQALVALLLRNNQFSGPLPDLSHAPQLRHLDVANNKLSGTLGSWIAELKDLAWLELEGNQLEGSLPPELPESLTRFSAGGNKFSGMIPASYATKVGRLRFFNCSGCSLQCPDPDFLAHIPITTHCKKTKRAWDN